MKAIHRVLRQIILGEKIQLREHKSTGNLRQNPYGWIVAQETMGSPVKFFRWDRDAVWAWTKTQAMASVFPSEETARREMESCEAGWKYRYTIRKISI
jgi:hypothetical protein